MNHLKYITPGEVIAVIEASIELAHEFQIFGVSTVQRICP